MAASPPPLGMLRSINTTSGSVFWTPITASGPLAASPTTSMSGCMLTSARRPPRRTPLSSAMKTRTFMTTPAFVPESER